LTEKQHALKYICMYADQTLICQYFLYVKYSDNLDLCMVLQYIVAYILECILVMYGIQ